MQTAFLLDSWSPLLLGAVTDFWRYKCISLLLWPAASVFTFCWLLGTLGEWLNLNCFSQAFVLSLSLGCAFSRQKRAVGEHYICIGISLNQMKKQKMSWYYFLITVQSFLQQGSCSELFKWAQWNSRVLKLEREAEERTWKVAEWEGLSLVLGTLKTEEKAQNAGCPLEARKGKRMHALLEPSKGNTLHQHVVTFIQ